MKIVVISNGFQPDYECGFVNGLAANKVHVTLISSDRTKYNQIDKSVECINLRGSQFGQRSKISKFLNLFGYYLRLFLYLLINRPDTLHLIGMFAYNNRYAWLFEAYLYKILSRKFILTVHNLVPHDNQSKKIVKSLLKIYKLPAILLVHTDKTAQSLICDFNIDYRKTRVMQHGLDKFVDLSESEINEAKTSLGLNSDLTITFFGAVLPYKGVERLIPIIENMQRPCNLIIAGLGKNADYTNLVQQSIAKSSKYNSIRWINKYLSDDEMNTILLASDVLAMPYHKIDQSGVLFSAFKYGLPIVAYDVGSFREYINEDCGFVVPQGDSVRFAKLLNEIEVSLKKRQSIQNTRVDFLWVNTVKIILGELQ